MDSNLSWILGIILAGIFSFTLGHSFGQVSAYEKITNDCKQLESFRHGTQGFECKTIGGSR